MRFNHQDTKTPRFGEILSPVSPETDRLAKEVVDAAFKVHSKLGPGLLESVYETCLAHELNKRDLKLTKMRLGLLINFNVSKIKDGIKRIIL
jgi:hypothetical protein